MDPWNFLLQFLPTHWPHTWQGSYSKTANGPSTAVTVTAASHDLNGGQPALEFTFTDAGASHTVKGVVVDLHGDAHIFLDGQQETDHTVLKVGTAVHFPLSTSAIVHLIFDVGGQRHDYRFEGQVN